MFRRVLEFCCDKNGSATSEGSLLAAVLGVGTISGVIGLAEALASLLVALK